MIRFDQWWFPDGETQLPKWLARMDLRVDGRLTYQHHKYAAALQLVRHRRAAVDVGAHVGLWSYYMAQDFAAVEAFEPMDTHRACFLENVPSPHVRLHPVALGVGYADVSLCTATAGCSGGT